MRFNIYTPTKINLLQKLAIAALRDPKFVGLHDPNPAIFFANLKQKLPCVMKVRKK